MTKIKYVKLQNDPCEAKSIAEFFRFAREANELSIRDFADNLGVAYPGLSRIEQGHVEFPENVIEKLVPYLKRAEKKHLRKLIEEYWAEKFKLGGES